MNISIINVSLPLTRDLKDAIDNGKSDHHEQYFVAILHVTVFLHLFTSFFNY